MPGGSVTPIKWPSTAPFWRRPPAHSSRLHDRRGEKGTYRCGVWLVSEQTLDYAQKENEAAMRV